MERFRFDSLARSFDYVWISILSPSWPDKKRPTTRRISGSRVYKIPKFRSPLHREFLAERDAILRLRFRSGAHRRETETRRNTTAGIFEIQRRLVAFFFFFFFLFLSFFLLCPLMYDLQKRKKKCCFDYSAKSFSGKIFFSTRLGCLGLLPRRLKGILVVGSNKKRWNGPTFRSSSSD